MSNVFYRQVINIVFVIFVTMLLFNIFKGSPLPKAAQYEINRVNYERAEFQFENIKGSICLKGLILDDLYVNNNKIFDQEKYVKLIPIWDGDNVPDESCIWKLSYQDHNSLRFKFKEYKVEFTFEQDKLKIQQIGPGKKYCRIISHIQDSDKPILYLDNILYTDMSNKWFKGTGYVASDSKYLSRIFLLEKKSDIIYEKFDNNIFALNIENHNNIDLLIIQKSLSILQKYNLEKLIDFGNYMWFITKPSFYLIEYLQSIFNNFGLCIILFCILTRIMSMPIAYSVFKSMQKMKKIKPQMSKIQNTHQNNPEEIRRNIAQLFKQEGINPISSILSLFVQLPILIALFTVFPILYGAYKTSFLWIIDLSQRDNIVFILASLSTILNLLNNEQKNNLILLVFPAIFIIFTYNMASGLLLGILMNNILMLLQTKFFNIIYR